MPFITPTCASFFTHWKNLAREGVSPHSSAFLDSAPAALMPYTLILELLPEGILVRFMGSGVVNRWRADFTYEYLSARIEAAQHQRFLDTVETICRHRVGARMVGQAITSFDRSISFEAVCLPLMVDEGKPPRCVRFSHELCELERNERKTASIWDDHPHWIDLGNGLPPGTVR